MRHSSSSREEHPDGSNHQSENDQEKGTRRSPLSGCLKVLLVLLLCVACIAGVIWVFKTIRQGEKLPLISSLLATPTPTPTITPTPTNTPPPTDTPTPTPTPTPKAVSKTLREQWKFTPRNVRTNLEEWADYRAKWGHRLIAVELVVENVGRGPTFFKVGEMAGLPPALSEPVKMKIEAFSYSGREYEYKLSNQSGPLRTALLPPGCRSWVEVVFDVPINAHNPRLAIVPARRLTGEKITFDLTRDYEYQPVFPCKELRYHELGDPLRVEDVWEITPQRVEWARVTESKTVDFTVTITNLYGYDQKFWEPYRVSFVLLDDQGGVHGTFSLPNKALEGDIPLEFSRTGLVAFDVPLETEQVRLLTLIYDDEGELAKQPRLLDYALYEVSLEEAIPTPMPTTTVSESTTLTIPESCDLRPGDIFEEAWNLPEVKGRVGCPLKDAYSTSAAEESFERGWMFWREDTEWMYAFYEDGSWDFFGDDFEVTEELGEFRAPEGFYVPVRGFGLVWRGKKSVREKLRWATEEEQWVDAVLQPFERGMMIWSPKSKRIVVLSQDGRWQEFGR